MFLRYSDMPVIIGLVVLHSVLVQTFIAVSAPCLAF